MSIGAEVASHLPFLRRYARALTGSQSTGDAFVRATLEAALADSDLAEKIGHGLHVGADRGRELADVVLERGAELAEVARERGAEWAEVARERGAEWAEVARERAPELAEAARERGAELADVARHRAVELAQPAREQLMHHRGGWH